MNMSDRIVLVAGATGKQGGAVARHLLERGFSVRGITRKTDSDAARQLAGLGVQVVQADLDDDRSLELAVQGAWGVFSVQARTPAGVAGEIEQGTRLARIARAARVEQYVYASVGSAQHQTGIPHFESKWRIEQVVRSIGFTGYTILRPVFFMENLLAPWVLQGDTLVLALAPTTALQMIAVDDIGRFASMAFERFRDLNRAEIDIAGDTLTLPQAAATLSRAWGRQVRYVRAPLEQVRQASPETATMFEWFERVGYSVDIPGLEAGYGIRMTRLDAWAQAHLPVA